MSTSKFLPKIMSKEKTYLEKLIENQNKFDPNLTKHINVLFENTKLDSIFSIQPVFETGIVEHISFTVNGEKLNTNNYDPGPTGDPITLSVFEDKIETKSCLSFGSKKNVTKEYLFNNILTLFKNKLIKTQPKEEIKLYESLFEKNQREIYEHLYVELHGKSNDIHRKTLRGGANVIVAQKDIAEKIENSQLIVTKYKIIESELEDILMAYRGDSYMDRGAAFSPSHLEMTEGNLKLHFNLKIQNPSFYKIIDFEFFK